MPPSTASRLSWSSLILYALASYSLTTVNNVIHCVRVLVGFIRRPPNSPDQVKWYRCRPTLSARVFYPPSHCPAAAGASKAKLPTLFTIHGGGFVVGNPEDQDQWNYRFAQDNPVLVVSVDYRKAPFWAFPHATYDIEALILAALADTSLPIDHSRVAVLGWSAGGNLALSVSQLPSMRGDGRHAARIHAAVPVYPVVDCTLPASQKALTRQYKPSIPGARSSATDFLLPLSPVFDWAYAPRGSTPAALTDPLLSPAYASRDALPPYIFVVACELDLLSMEAWRMACRLAGRPEPEQAVIGRSEIGPVGDFILDDERFAFETRTEGSSYRWLLVPDAQHGFDGGLGRRTADKAQLEDYALKTAKCAVMIAEWLFAGPFAA